MADYITVAGAKYIASAVKKAQYPVNGLPEIPLIGRSNVGKSSLINSLTRTHNLAHISKKPGKTRTINFFELRLKLPDETSQELYLVDLPGYGYAETGRAIRNTWTKFINEYFTSSPNIRFVAQLVDIRHDITELDVNMFNFLVANNIPVLLVATKADKVSKCAKDSFVAKTRQRLKISDLSVLPYSSKKNEGRSDLLDTISASLL